MEVSKTRIKITKQELIKLISIIALSSFFMVMLYSTIGEHSIKETFMEIGLLLLIIPGQFMVLFTNSRNTELKAIHKGKKDVIIEIVSQQIDEDKYTKEVNENSEIHYSGKTKWVDYLLSQKNIIKISSNSTDVTITANPLFLNKIEGKIRYLKA